MRLKLLSDGQGSVEGLPVMLIVMLVVGIVALAAMVTAMGQFKPPRVLSANVEKANGFDGNLIAIDAGGSNRKSANITGDTKIKVIDANGKPVDGASVTISGLSSAASGKTASYGTVTFSDATEWIQVPVLEENQNEGYLKLEVTANGFIDYVNEKAIKIVRI